VKTDVSQMTRDEAQAALSKLIKAQIKFGKDDKRAALIVEVQQRLRELRRAA